MRRESREKAAEGLDFLCFTRLAIASCLDTEALQSYNEVKNSLANQTGVEKPSREHAVKGLAARLKSLGAKKANHGSRQPS